MEPVRSDHNQRVDSTESKVEFIRFKRNHFYAMLVLLAFVAGLASGFLIWGSDTSLATGVVEETSSIITEEQEAFRLDVGQDDDPALGPKDAKVIIIEFSDFNCPFCQKFHRETFPDLMDKYDGQIQFVYRDFPIVGGGQVGIQAAQAANCAAEQGDYWDFHDALFSGRYNLDRKGFEQYALELGLDQGALEECIDSGRYEEEVRADLQSGVDLGITGTPTFFINGIPLVGSQPLSQFVEVIEAELER